MNKLPQQSRKIPTDKEFAAASKEMAGHLAKEAEIRNRILSGIPEDIPCHDIWVWLNNPTPTVSFIYPSNSELEAHEKNGFKTKIDSAIKEALLSFGIDNFSIEYYSHQFVLEQYNGNYDKYFR
ncbi:MAG: hypothetical protein ACOZBW_14830 [Thermodesulfobacteriota bacterium]